MSCTLHKEIDVDVGHLRLEDGSVGMVLKVRCRSCQVDFYFDPTDLTVMPDGKQLNVQVRPHRIILASAETPDELNYRSRN